jgi:alkylhydroperoxidase family enzyme
MARLPAFDDESIDDPRVKAGFDDMAARMGEVTENVRILAHKPLYVELIQNVSSAIDAPTEIDPVLKQLVELKTARFTGCEYSIDLLEGCLLQKGVSDAKLHELDFYEESTLYDDRERLALSFAEQMLLDAVDDSLFNEVRRTFSIVETLELIVSVGLESFYSLLNRTLGLKPQNFRERALAEADKPSSTAPAS